jgi:hypothetical protein
LRVLLQVRGEERGGWGDCGMKMTSFSFNKEEEYHGTEERRTKEKSIG